MTDTKEAVKTQPQTTNDDIVYDSNKLPMMSPMQLFNLCIGIIGIQFAWSMQIALSSRVLEPLGANPFLFGLIWCAGPVTGLLVQPIVGAISDRTWTKIGRRRPFLLAGSILGAIALVIFPFSGKIMSALFPSIQTLTLGALSLPLGLFFAALMIWIIDACVNVSQGPYRALVPDNVHPSQQAVANGYLNFAFGAGSVIALGVAPALKLFNIPMSIEQQYIFAAIALVCFMAYTSLVIREYRRPTGQEKEQDQEAPAKKPSLFDAFKVFAKSDREIHKLCGVQFLIWVGIMCMFIYLTPYIVHNIYGLPDMSSAEYKKIEQSVETTSPAIQKENKEYVKPLIKKYKTLLSEGKSNEIKTGFAQYGFGASDATVNVDNSKKVALMKAIDQEATNTAQLALVAFNAVALLLSIPLGHLCNRFSKKSVFTVSLGFLAIAFTFAPVVSTPMQVITMMAFAGVAWATILSVPFSFLADYMPVGKEGSIMGIFNMFIAGPQLISATLVGWVISQNILPRVFGDSHNWAIAFMVASGCVFAAIIALQFIKEKKNSSNEVVAGAAGH